MDAGASHERSENLSNRLVETIMNGRAMTWGELANHVGEAPDSRAMLDAARSRQFSQTLMVASPSGRTEVPPAEALVFALRDIDEVAKGAALWRLALRYLRTPATHVHTEGELRSVFRSAKLKSAFSDAIRSALAAGELPAGIRAVLRRGHFYLLLQDDLLTPFQSLDASTQNSAPADNDDDSFGQAFEAAFRRLDIASGRRNFVKLLDLRRALPQFSRLQFDRGLNALRRAGLFSLDAAEGTHDRTTPEERQAGLVEAGRRLLYCARR